MTYPRELQKRRSRSTDAHSLPYWPQTAGETVSLLSIVLTSFLTYIRRWQEVVYSPRTSTRTTVWSTAGLRYAWWRGKRHNRATSSPAFHRPKWPSLLCRAANGGGKDPTGGATDEDVDGAGVGPLAPACRPPWSGQHHPTDPWPPPMEAEVKRFCQSGPTCQKASPGTPPPSPLIPLPVIEVPFERIGMDLVGLLPKSVLRLINPPAHKQRAHRQRVRNLSMRPQPNLLGV